jgi:tripartite-type tricarboxylate transporter receptor subunit TctC
MRRNDLNRHHQEVSEVAMAGRFRKVWGILVCLALVASSHARADWPADKPISLIVPFSAGGGTDLIARLLAAKLGERLGQTVVVENIGGAGGTIGTARATQAPADGYTLVLGVDSPVAIAQYVNPAAVKYDTLRDLAPIALVTQQAMVIMGKPNLEAKSIGEVLAAAKAKPGTITYATSGIGTVLHLAMERINQRADAKMIHVPYRGGAQAVTDLLANQVDLAILPTGSAIPLVKGQKVKGLASTDSKRLGTLPDVPAMSEVPGFSDFAMTAWIGIFAPAGTPATVVERLNRELNEVLKDKDVLKKFDELAITPGGGSAADLKAFVQAEQKRYQDVVKAANIATK